MLIKLQTIILEKNYNLQDNQIESQYQKSIGNDIELPNEVIHKPHKFLILNSLNKNDDYNK